MYVLFWLVNLEKVFWTNVIIILFVNFSYITYNMFLQAQSKIEYNCCSLLYGLLS